MAELKILIVGGGIAGHCLAYWLTKTKLDLSIVIIERAPSPRVTGQAVDIRGKAVNVIRRMGLEAAIKSRHTTETGLAFVKSSGKVIAQFDATGDPEHQSGTSEYEILRADLARLFMDETSNIGNIEYRYDESVQSIAQTGSAVNVVFKSGKEETFDLIVAADGSTSKTRALILGSEISTEGYKFLGQYIAFFSVPSQPGDPKLWQWYNAVRGRSISLRPHGNPSTMGAYLCITTPSATIQDPKVESAMDEGGVEGMKSMLHEYFEDAGFQAKRLLAGMDESTDFYMGRSAMVKLPKWVNDRGIVVGDAAHAAFGVGTAMAIQGAYVLAGELSKIQSSADVPVALRSYETVFRPLVKDCQTLIPGGLQLGNPQTAWGIAIMNTILWVAGWLRVDKWFGSFGESKWELPEYDWINLPTT